MNAEGSTVMRAVDGTTLRAQDLAMARVSLRERLVALRRYRVTALLVAVVVVSVGFGALVARAG